MTLRLHEILLYNLQAWNFNSSSPIGIFEKTIFLFYKKPKKIWYTYKSFNNEFSTSQKLNCIFIYFFTDLNLFIRIHNQNIDGAFKDLNCQYYIDR